MVPQMEHFDPASQSWRVFGRIVFGSFFASQSWPLVARGPPPGGLENHENPVQKWTPNHTLFGDGFRRHLAPLERLLALIASLLV